MRRCRPAGMTVPRALLAESESSDTGKHLINTASSILHDMSANLIRMMLEDAGK